MLSQRNRVDRKSINLIFKQGTSITSPCFTFKFLLVHDAPPRISVIVPKHIARLATKRNSLRRSGYAALRQYIDTLPSGLVGIFLFKKHESDPSIIRNEIQRILNKIN